MDTNMLYSTSQALRLYVRNTAERVLAAAGQRVELIEYITLPDHGQRVILRFGLVESRPLPFADADALESRLRMLAGSDYWATLTGGHEESTNYDVDRQLTLIGRTLPDDSLRFCPTQHSTRVRHDAHIVRAALDLADDFLVWEIEVPISDMAAPTVLRVIDTAEQGQGLSSQHASRRVAVGGIACEVVFLRNSPSFLGCVKAYFAAQEHQMALNSYIVKFDGLGK